LPSYGAMFIISVWNQNFAARWLKCSWVNLGNIGALIMHQIRCFAVGGFKINGPPRIGKGPMDRKEDLEPSNEASLPSPTRAGRIELCQEAIKEARRCLESNDKDCVMRLIEELVRNQCHDGRLIGKEIADGVRGLFTSCGSSVIMRRNVGY